MQIKVMSRAEVQTYNPPDGAVVISINEPHGKGIPQAHLADNYSAYLRLYFDDAEPTFYAVAGAHYMEEGHAEEVVKFLRDYKDAPELVIHCFAGISRSTGTALAALEILGASEEVIRAGEKSWPLHNRFVRNLILKAWRDGTHG